MNNKYQNKYQQHKTEALDSLRAAQTDDPQHPAYLLAAAQVEATLAVGAALGEAAEQICNEIELLRMETGS